MKAGWQTLAPRERRLVQIGAVGAVVLLVVGVLLPLNGSVARAHQRVAQKHEDLTWMRSVAPELASGGAAFSAPASGQSLVIIVDRAAREAGLAGALVSSEPSGPNGLRVRFENARFDQLVGLIARLAEHHGARVESASVDAAGAPGVVNAGFVLRVG